MQRLLLLDRLAQVRRREVATSGGDLGRSAGGCGCVTVSSRRPGGRLAGGSRRRRSRSHASVRPQAPVAGAVRLHLRVPIRAVPGTRPRIYTYIRALARLSLVRTCRKYIHAGVRYRMQNYELKRNAQRETLHLPCANEFAVCNFSGTQQKATLSSVYK